MKIEDILNKCKVLKKQKKSVGGFLRDQGFSEKRISEIKKSLRVEAEEPEVQSEEIPKHIENRWTENLKFTPKYTYNREDDKYVMYLKSVGGFAAIKGKDVEAIRAGYSNWLKKPNTLNEICRDLEIPRNVMTEVLRVLGITHDSEPITAEQLQKAGEPELIEIVGDMLQKKRFLLRQKFEKESWKDTQAAATKWNHFTTGIYNPFTEFLSTWQPPTVPKVKLHQPSKGSKKKTLVVGLSDLHYGAKASSLDSYRGKSYSTEQAKEGVVKYFEQIKELVENRTYSVDKCVVTSLGDILHSQGQGFTVKGTQLVFDCLKEEQFQAAFDSISLLLQNLLTLFPTVEVKSVKGNHNDFGDWVLFKALEALYHNEDRIKFDVFQTDHGLFRVDDTLFVISHGYSAEYKGRLPQAGAAREAYINNLFLAHPEKLVGAKHKILLTADQHHLEMKEYSEFEHYMLSTAVKGDKHSEAMGHNNKPRQSTFVVGTEGIEEIIYCYV